MEKLIKMELLKAKQSFNFYLIHGNNVECMREHCLGRMIEESKKIEDLERVLKIMNKNY